MEIIINTADEMSDTDRAVLLSLLMSEKELERSLSDEPEEAEPEPEPEPKPAKKAKKATKKAAAKPKEEPEPEDEDEPEEDAADEPEDDESDEGASGVDGASMETAVELATQLVSSGKSDVVKAILADIGVKRVSELEGDDVATFIEAAS